MFKLAVYCLAALLSSAAGCNPDAKDLIEAPETKSESLGSVSVSDSDFECPADGLHADPADCRSFYQCDGEKFHHQACAAGTVFNPNLGICDFESDYDCEGGKEKFQCPSNGLYPNPAQCSSFYNCYEGKANLQQCPAGTVFNPNIGTCDFEANYDCNAVPVPPFEDMGCYKNKNPTKLTKLEGSDERLDHYNYKKREDAIVKCYSVAKDRGFEYFSVGNKGQCFASNGNSHKYYGKARSCPANGKGYYGVVNVYKIGDSAPVEPTAGPVPTAEAIPEEITAAPDAATTYAA